jgi:hypothetical protein
MFKILPWDLTTGRGKGRERGSEEMRERGGQGKEKGKESKETR